MKRKYMFLAAIALALMLILSACDFPFSFGKTYTVTFDLSGGSLINGDTVQSIKSGEAAIAPEVENGRMSLSWDADFSNVTSDMTVTAKWTKVELSAPEVAEIVQRSTVTINCDFYNGASGSGSGFFIDDNGTIVTSYHVIEYATAISVEIMDGGKYDVDKIISFNELNDLAVLKIDLPGSPGLDINTDSVRVGETVYANGSALGTLKGTFTSGTASNVNRLVCGISCIQMDAAISSGNSGGPLVNAYAEVIGVNALSYIDGESLNMAVRIENLDNLTEVNYSIKDYEEWIMREADRSYSTYYDDSGSFFYSTVNTYTYITDRQCDYSVDFDGSYYYGYVDECEYYIYEYHEAEFDKYVEYLKSKGFDFLERESFDDGVSYYYVNSWTELMVDMFQYTYDELWIWVTYY